MSGSGSGIPIPIPSSDAPLAGTGTPATLTTLVVEDGTGKADANSYVSLDDATLYLYATQGAGNAWSSASVETQQRSLIVATQYLDIRNQGRWRGVKNSGTQALAWPRYEAEDDDEYTLDSDVVPQKLKDACCELALRVVSGDDLLGVQTQPGEVASESVTVGPVTESKTYLSGRPAGGYQYPRVDSLLSSLVEGRGRVFRG